MPLRTQRSFTRGTPRGQHRLDGGPFIIGEFIAHDTKPPVPVFESQMSGQTKCSWPGPQHRLLWGKAEIKRQARAADPVENDPEPTNRMSPVTTSLGSKADNMQPSEKLNRRRFANWFFTPSRTAGNNARRFRTSPNFLPPSLKEGQDRGKPPAGHLVEYCAQNADALGGHHGSRSGSARIYPRLYRGKFRGP